MEFVSPEGLRLDGRRPKELRQLKAELGVLQSADGSATFEMGNTKVEFNPSRMQVFVLLLFVMLKDSKYLLYINITGFGRRIWPQRSRTTIPDGLHQSNCPLRICHGGL